LKLTYTIFACVVSVLLDVSNITWLYDPLRTMNDDVVSTSVLSTDSETLVVLFMLEILNTFLITCDVPLLTLTPTVNWFLTFYTNELLIFDVILLLVVMLKSFVVIFTKLLVVLRFKYVLLLPILKSVTVYLRFVTVISTLVLLINNLSLPLILNR